MPTRDIEPACRNEQMSQVLAIETMPRQNLNESIFSNSIEKHRSVLAATETCCADGMEHLCKVCAGALADGKRIFFFGNGGSAADAQHIATELSIRFINNRRALAGLALTTDSSVLTACGNDLGFDQIFSRQLEAFGQSGDVALGISTSGNSPNIVRALETARQLGITAAAFAGKDGGKLRGLADPLIVVPCDETARIQEMHILLGHILCAEIEARLGIA
jgi:D-sedoheptulose 7-phosphate isomerase